ncbi:MAG: hypothetical protein ABJK20_18720 [Halieaceae bacterium]
MIRTLHLAIGAAGLLLFVLTGQYMERFAGVPELPDTERMLYRSNHIYLLLVCACNIAAGFFMKPAGPANVLQMSCSVALMALPFLFAVAFFIEPASGSLERPITRLSLFLAFGTVSLMLISELWSRVRGTGE